MAIVLNALKLEGVGQLTVVDLNFRVSQNNFEAIFQ